MEWLSRQLAMWGADVKLQSSTITVSTIAGFKGVYCNDLWTRPGLRLTSSVILIDVFSILNSVLEKSLYNALQ